MDNILVIGNIQKEINKIKGVFTEKLKMSDLSSVSCYLGLKITCNLLAGKMFYLKYLILRKSWSVLRYNKQKALILQWWSSMN